MRALVVTALAAWVLAAPARVLADGAFPSAEAVLVPADRPQEIVLVTNFGVVATEDGGQRWSWSCERDENAFGLFYQFGPAPRRRLFAVANGKVITSDDATCSWQIAGGLLAGQVVTDVFADPTNAERVLAVGLAGGDYAVFESADGGTTFGSVPYRALPGEQVTGVEIAPSDPRVVYVALMSADRTPRLARTADGGASWTVSDLGAVLGLGLPRIIAVDPTDAATVFLRFVSAMGGEAVAVTRDGGATVARTLSIPFYFTSFAWLSDGALALSAVAAVSPALRMVLYLSHDRGASFQQNEAVPGVLALGQRDGVLYAAADNVADGFALGASRDEGATWEPVLRFDQIGSIKPCLSANAQCQSSCAALAGQGFGSPGKIWEETVCTGAAGSGGGTGTAGTTGGSTGATGGSSDGCGMARPAPNDAPLQLLLMAGLLADSWRRARHPRRTGTSRG